MCAWGRGPFWSSTAPEKKDVCSSLAVTPVSLLCLLSQASWDSNLQFQKTWWELQALWFGPLSHPFSFESSNKHAPGGEIIAGELLSWGIRWRGEKKSKQVKNIFCKDNYRLAVLKSWVPHQGFSLSFLFIAFDTWSIMSGILLSLQPPDRCSVQQMPSQCICLCPSNRLRMQPNPIVIKDGQVEGWIIWMQWWLLRGWGWNLCLGDLKDWL